MAISDSTPTSVGTWEALEHPRPKHLSSPPTSQQKWPREVTGDLTWTSTSFKSENDYALILTSDEVVEITDALQHFYSEYLVISWAAMFLLTNISAWIGWQ